MQITHQHMKTFGFILNKQTRYYEHPLLKNSFNLSQICNSERLPVLFYNAGQEKLINKIHEVMKIKG